MQDKKNKNVLLTSFDKLTKHPKFTLRGVTIPVTKPYDITAEPKKLKFGEIGKLPAISYRNKKNRTYFSEVSTGDDLGYEPVVYNEDIDVQPLPDRKIGDITAHGKTSSYYAGELWVTVHKYITKMGKSKEVIDENGNVVKIPPNSNPNKMGGMASINCAASETEFCKENRRKALILNNRIKNAELELTKIEKRLEVLKKSRIVDGDELINLNEEFETLRGFLDHARYHICGFCYAVKAETTGLKKHKITPKYTSQGEFVRGGVIPRDKIPQFKSGEVIRLDAHGELEKGERGVTQFINYLNIVMHNPHTFFTLWTKNPMTVNDAYRKIGRIVKPPNLTIIYSNQFIDAPVYTPPSVASWADGVFNVVFLDKYMSTKEGYINVNGKRVFVTKCKKLCRECKVCYSGMKNFAIIELEKNVGAKNQHVYERKIKPNRRINTNVRDYIPMKGRFKA